MPSTSLLRPGMFARAAITTTTVAGLTVPVKAVQPQTRRFRSGYGSTSVVAGSSKSGRVEIKKGLQPGVVVAGAGYLKDGDRVQVVQPLLTDPGPLSCCYVQHLRLVDSPTGSNAGFVLILTVVGWFSFTQLGIDTNPNIDVPAVSITVTQPGAGTPKAR